ncbi:hypothetical protein [uncultured Dokdonia sp.]|uniref:hypothetical protein n=1 Tax=uncultured Dokdonia sp. TaxID=575653 RepID=UPI002637A650|nr:hypothetical protein [uncultured Dokdonia sp.]
MIYNLIKKYYWIAISINWLPSLFILALGELQGEGQLAYIVFIGWGLLCTIIYGFYLLIPEFKKNWEKVASFLFPTVFFMIGFFLINLFEAVILPLSINLAINLIFILHFNKKTKNLNKQFYYEQ